MLPPDTVPVARHTTQADYCTGDLKLGRIAVLADLGRYLRVPFDCLVKRVGATHSPQDLQQIRKNLIESKILTHDESGLRWTDFILPAKSKGSEETVFKPLGSIITGILAEVPNHRVSFQSNPNETPLSQRNNTSRPDAYLVLSNEKTETHWFDIAVPFEFKKERGIESLQDDEQKMIWSLHNVMREDPLRRFAFGITIEDNQLRLWLSNRALLAVTEPIDFFENVDDVISLFYALGSASASSTMKDLGWDPTVERIVVEGDFQYKFTIGDEVFTTTRELATYGADSMVGRGTRVYEATDAKGNHVAIKDSWRDVTRQSEGEILEAILASCKEKLQPDELAEARKHFVGIRLCQDVTINSTRDETLDPMGAEEHDRPWEWVSIKLSHTLSTRTHLPSTGDVPNSGRPSTFLPQLGNNARNVTDIPTRVHTRTVFHDVGVTLQDVTSLANILNCLYGALRALYFMHKAGWVHRDFSITNTIWVGGVGKLGDFEYAKKIDSNTNTAHDVRTGTMYFMAVEVENERYLFYPNSDSLQLDTTRRLKSSFRINFLHDIESVWWAFTWIFLYHTDTTTANTGHSFDTQREKFQLAFPGTTGRASREHFFIDVLALQDTCTDVLSKTYLDVCEHIPHFAQALQRNYRIAEAGYPSVVLNDTLREDIHEKAAEYLCIARERAGVIELCPLPDLLEQKMPRPGDETSPLPKKEQKRPRPGEETSPPPKKKARPD